MERSMMDGKSVGAEDGEEEQTKRTEREKFNSDEVKGELQGLHWEYGPGENFRQ